MNYREILREMNDMSFDFVQMREYMKALIAYSMGVDIPTASTDDVVEKVVEYYYNSDHITSIMNPELMDLYEVLSGTERDA